MHIFALASPTSTHAGGKTFQPKKVSQNGFFHSSTHLPPLAYNKLDPQDSREFEQVNELGARNQR